MGSREIGYVVIEYNQASHEPRLPTGADVYWRREDAERERDWLAEQTAEVGRRERHEVAVIVPLSEWE